MMLDFSPKEQKRCEKMLFLTEKELAGGLSET